MIETERLTLRPLTEGDAAFYLQLVNEPSFIENIGDKGVRTLDDARNAIVTGPMAMHKALGYSLMLVQQKSDGAAIGMCGLIKRDTLPDTDIGYAYLPAYWGRGYAFEAAAAVVAFARDKVGLKRLLGIVSPRNTASNQLLRKLGLSFIELLVLKGETKDTNLYGLEFPPHHS
ncbi:GNAT family N-acetyltransferase [Pseudoduganella sp. UC29_106]|uniref:GNAT family N-acetyltransferase n=1 Tax=Pseudoduganella sp. UC29_106 TaxID=3374553 RepID=UPI003756C74E